jgi:hypothetical protein
MFRRDRNVTVTDDGTGMVRIRIGEPADVILQTRIRKLSLDAEAQYNLESAIAAIELAPEVQSAERKLKVDLHERTIDHLVVPPLPQLPHMPAEISDVTMDQALDRVSRTWGRIVFFGACDPPATYDIFFANY